MICTWQKHFLPLDMRISLFKVGSAMSLNTMTHAEYLYYTFWVLYTVFTKFFMVSYNEVSFTYHVN
jgi:hypothetical protein